MKRIVSLSFVAVLLVCLILSVSSCSKSPIPKGNYTFQYGLFEEFSEAKPAIIKDNHFYKWCDGEEEDGYMIYEDYIFELNEDKTQIKLTFVGYKFEGENQAGGTSMVRFHEQNYERGMAIGVLATKDLPSTYDFELGDKYFVIDGEKYTFNKK